MKEVPLFSKGGNLRKFCRQCLAKGGSWGNFAENDVCHFVTLVWKDVLKFVLVLCHAHAYIRVRVTFHLDVSNVLCCIFVRLSRFLLTSSLFVQCIISFCVYVLHLILVFYRYILSLCFISVWPDVGLLPPTIFVLPHTYIISYIFFFFAIFNSFFLCYASMLMCVCWLFVIPASLKVNYVDQIFRVVCIFRLYWCS